jgi:NAD(P)-dependent dehydrogenase (short-subunit alcohol dehydrogenase family)
MSSQPLAGRVAVVTDGTGGIGAAICKALAQAGAAVAVGYNSASEKAEAMLGALPGDGHMALRIPVTDSAALKDAIAAVDKRHSRLDLLVNSAGITRFVPHAAAQARRSGGGRSRRACGGNKLDVHDWSHFAGGRRQAFGLIPIEAPAGSRARESRIWP